MININEMLDAIDEEKNLNAIGTSRHSFCHDLNLNTLNASRKFVMPKMRNQITDVKTESRLLRSNLVSRFHRAGANVSRDRLYCLFLPQECSKRWT